MTVLTIPIVSTPAQTFAVQLGEQACQMIVRQRRTGVYLDLYVAGVAIVLGVLALDRVGLVREAYLGFVGTLYFADTDGSEAPSYEGLGTRWVLLWDDGQ